MIGALEVITARITVLHRELADRKRERAAQDREIQSVEVLIIELENLIDTLPPEPVEPGPRPRAPERFPRRHGEEAGTLHPHYITEIQGHLERAGKSGMTAEELGVAMVTPTGTASSRLSKMGKLKLALNKRPRWYFIAPLPEPVAVPEQPAPAVVDLFPKPEEAKR